jgi:DNA-directed RNA polymerase specialized sigma24 family protein
MLSLPAGTPKTHIHRAKAQMREQLAKHFAREPRHD